jgi:amino acid permease
MEVFATESFWGETKMRLLICYSIALFVLFPLCLIKTISKMRYASTFGVFSVFLIIIIVVIQCPSFYYHNIVEGKQEINLLDFEKGFGPDLKFIQSISTIIYAYECHAGIFPVISSLTNPTKSRMQKVFKNATSANVIAYIIITLAGYLSQPENTPDLILEREKISKNDYLMTIGLCLFSITLSTKISASYNCLRALILNIMKYDPTNYPNGINFILTVIILSSTTFVAAMFQNIADYISLNGSFYGLFIAVIMPGIIYIKSNSHPIYHIKNILAIIFILTLCSIGALTIYFTLKRIFDF